MSAEVHVSGRKSAVAKEQAKGPKRPRSVVWYYFEKLPNEHQRARCKICNSFCHHANNTSNLFKHLRVKHPATYKEAEAQKEAEMDLYLEMKAKMGKPMARPGVRGRKPKSVTQAVIKAESDSSPSVSMTTNFIPTLTHSTPGGRKPYGMEKVRQSMNRALMNMIASDLIPVSIVESSGFRDFVKILDSRYDLPTKKSIVKTMLPELAEETKNKIKLEVVIASYFALTVETWIYRESQNYITLTAHFIRDSWEMSSVVLETFDITEENTSEAIALNLKRITDEWGISERIISLISDNRDNVISAATLSTGWEHLACFGQMLNSVVLTALKSVAEIARIQKKTSEAVAYFEKSVKASDTLAAVQQQHNLPVHKLKQEVETRWNSTFYMMERMVEQFEAVNTVLCFLCKDHMCLCDDEVELIRLVLDVLRPFEAATRELCSESYASMSKVIPIATLLQQVVASSGVVTPGPQSALKSALLHQMQTQFANLESNYTLAVSTLLDPRFKRHAFTDAAALEASQHRLLSEIINTASSLDAENNTDSNFNNDTNNVSFWNMFDRKVSEAGAQKTTSSEADNESRRYFKEANIPRNSNPLQWWRLNQVSLLIILIEQKPRHSSVPANGTTTNAGANDNRGSSTNTQHVDVVDNFGVLSVSTCAANLVTAVSKVISLGEKEGRESKDKEFSDQMLSACETLDLAKTNLYVTAQNFEIDHSSPNAGHAVCQMARDVLQAVIKVLLVIDNRQVSYLLSLITQARKSLGLVGSVQMVEQLVPSFRSLTESVLQLKQRVDLRKHDLCSHVCRDQLSASMSVLRKCLPSLSMAMQTYLKYKGNISAKDSRDTVLKQMSTTLDEIQSLLQIGVVGSREEELPCSFVALVDKIMEILSEDKRRDLGEDFESTMVSLIQHCMMVANLHRGSYKDVIIASCHRILQAKFRLVDLNKMMTESPNVTDIRVEFDSLCETVLDEICDLEKHVNMTLLHLIVETFIDTSAPLDRLVKAGLEYKDNQPPFSEAHSDLIKNFSDYADNVCQIALLVAASSTDVSKISEIHSSVQCLETLDPDIVPVVVAISRRQSDSASVRHLRLLVQRWQLEIETVVKAVDKMADPRVFLEVTENKMTSKMNAMSPSQKSSLRSSGEKVLAYALRAAQMGTRLVDGHNDPIYRNGLMTFVRKITDAINLSRAALNDVLVNPPFSKLSDTLDRRLKVLHGSVADLRQGLDARHHPDLMSHERDIAKHRSDDSVGAVLGVKSVGKSRVSVSKLTQGMETKLTTAKVNNGGGFGLGASVAGSVKSEGPGEVRVQPARSTGVGNTQSWPAAIQPDEMTDNGSGGSVKSWLRKGEMEGEGEEVSAIQLVVNRLLTAAASGDKMSTDSLTSDILGWTNHIVDASDSLGSHGGQIAKAEELKQLTKEVDMLVPSVIQSSKFMVSGDKDKRDELYVKAQEWSTKLEKARIIVDVAADRWLLLTHALTQAISTCDDDQVKRVLESITQAQQEMGRLLLKSRFFSGRYVERGVDTVEFLADCHKDIENLAITISTSVQVAAVSVPRTTSERWQLSQVSRDWSVLMTCVVAEIDRISDAMEMLGREKFPGLRTKAAEKESRLASILEEETNSLLELVDCIVIGDPNLKIRSDELVTEMNEALSDVIGVARQPVASSKVPNHALFCRLRIGLARNRWIEKAIQVRDLVHNNCFEYSGHLRQILHAMMDFRETGPSEDALQKEQQKLTNEFLEVSSSIKQKALACVQISADLPKRTIIRSSLDVISGLTSKIQDALKDPDLCEADVSYLSELWGAHLKRLICHLNKLEGVRPGIVTEIERLTKAKTSSQYGGGHSRFQGSEELVAAQAQPSVSQQSIQPVVRPDNELCPSLSQSSYASPRGDIGTPLGKSVQVLLKNAEFLDTKLHDWHDEETETGGGVDASGVTNAYSSCHIVKQATAMTALCSHMALFTEGEGPLKTSSEVIGAAVALTRHSSVLESFGRVLLGMVVDNRCRDNLNASISALNSLSSQLHIIATALHNSARSFEGERMLVRNASNLLSAVKALFIQVESCAIQGMIEPGDALDPSAQSVLSFLSKIRDKHQRYLEEQRRDGQLDELGLRRMEIHDPPSLTTLLELPK